MTLLILILNSEKTCQTNGRERDTMPLQQQMNSLPWTRGFQLSQLLPLLFLPGKGNADLFWDWESLLASEVKGSMSVFRSVTVTSHSLTFSAFAHCWATSVSTCLCSVRSVLFPKTTTVTQKEEQKGPGGTCRSVTVSELLNSMQELGRSQSSLYVNFGSP